MDQRLLLVLAAAVIAVGAFVLLKSGSDDDGAPSTTATVATVVQTATTPAATVTTTTTTTTTRAAPEVTLIRTKDLKPVGGIAKISVDKGDRIRFTVTSNVAEEVHFHGYDVAKDVGPGQPARFVVPATIVGRFEVELEHASVQIADVSVEP